ncbi:hypothetical protein Q1695_011392 [Nippostrongylus brasiliensis]|nr:hypothetical protein Q1695_011392 [Nippostrongylus brasiliensis]
MPSEFVDEKLPAEILSKLASFREFDKFCDVILEADGSSKDKCEPTSPTSIRAHKNVLAAASPYFSVLVGVRLPSMSREFLLNRVYNEPMIRGSSACMGMLGTVFHDLLSEEKTSRVPESWYRRRQTPHSKIVIAGGGPCGCLFLADVNIYDPCSKQWTSAAPLLEPRCDFGMATVGDSIYAVGGEILVFFNL